MTSTLNIISEIADAINSDMNPDNHNKLWALFKSLSSDLEFDASTNQSERSSLEQLKRWLSNASTQINQGNIRPDFGAARVVLSTLQSSIERRTIGVDGRPLRS